MMLSHLVRRMTFLLTGLLLVAFGFMIGTVIVPGTADGLPDPLLLQVPVQQHGMHDIAGYT